MQKSFTKEDLIEITPNRVSSPIIEISENNIIFEGDGNGICQVQISKDSINWDLVNIGIFKLPCSIKLCDTKTILNQEYKYVRFITNESGCFNKCTIAF